MSSPVLLTHVTPIILKDGRLDAAIALAKTLNARLIGATGCEPPAPTVTENGPIEPPGDLSRLLEAELKGLSETFLDRVRTGLGEDRAEWRGAMESSSTFLPRQARAADMAVIASKTDKLFDVMRLDPADMLFGAGRPVLTLPAGAGPLELGTAVLAWKDTPQARRAAYDGLALMKLARRVIVLGVGERVEKAALEAVSAWLSTHGVRPEIRFDGDFRGPAGPHVRHVAAETKAGLIVAGAYGRSRMREFVFGGVTRDLLTNSGVPCLMAH
jgi:nucleotide-binding universal stress UspA family protein